ncbi:MAG: hypothetical protein M3M94_03890, partial [Actinomycetota bacterium]|nr:hypothetical protein [Actinomycetota bacterium]
MNSVPTGSIGLDQVVLSSLPVDWAAILHGTGLAGLPLQTLTLRDVYANATVRARFEALTVAQSGIAQTILRGTPLSAVLLGGIVLDRLAPGVSGADWCARIENAGASCNFTVNPAENTLVGLSIASVPVGSIPVGSIPVGSIPVGSIAGGIAGTPVGSIPVGSIEIAATRLAAVPVGSIPSPDTIVDCTRVDCSATSTHTLGYAASLSPSAIRPGAKLEDLYSVLAQLEMTVNEIIIGMLGRDALPWEQFPLDGTQEYAGTGKALTYNVDFDVRCASVEGLAINVKLPQGFLVKRGSSRFSYGDAPSVAGADPTTHARRGARWTSLPGTACPSGLDTQHVKLTFEGLAGLNLSEATTDASVRTGDLEFGDSISVSDRAPVLVTQNWEGNDTPETAATIQPGTLLVGHIAAAGDKEVYRIPIPARGTRTTFYLSHIAEDADFDLVVGKPATDPLQSSPVGSIPVGSIPVEDRGLALENSSQSLPPETLQDIPVGSIPVGSISANRGSADEVAQVLSQGETGYYTVVVSGYNGSHSKQPFVLRAKTTPPPTLPPCPPRTFAFDANPYSGGDESATAGNLPSSLPSTTRTLFLVARNRMSDLYGATAANAMLNGIGPVASRAEVRGAVLQVDGDAAVRSALQAWDASPCSIDAANAVVRRINDVVTRYRSSLPNLRSLVLLGTDEAFPMARIPDLVTISPEFDEAGDLQFTTANLTKGNALYASAATGHFLSDDPYAAFTRVPWLGRELSLPQIMVGRLVETPADIQRQLDLYIAANGVLDPDTALTTAYDFLKDGGDAVDKGLRGLVGDAQGTRLIGDDWSRSTLQSIFTNKTVPDDVVSVNAHYNHWLLQPAKPEAAGTTQFALSDMLTTGDLPALPSDPSVEPAFARRIVFTMGCHGGLNVANTLIASPTADQTARLRDWTESWLGRQRSAVYFANTGFGYGDTEANALSERLMSTFARNLGEGGTVGEDWLRSVHEYFTTAGAYSVYDEKALLEATFYGLPFWRLADSAAASAPSPPSVQNDPVSGLEAANFNVNLQSQLKRH